MKNSQVIIVEPAKLSDVDTLLRIENNVFVAADGMLTRRSFRRHILSRHIFLIARHSGEEARPIGYILVFVHKISARIYSLAVDPLHQCRGVAKRLVQAALEAIKVAQLKTVRLEVRESNLHALNLYHSLGFQKERVRPNYYGPKQPAVLMRLTTKLAGT